MLCAGSMVTMIVVGVDLGADDSWVDWQWICSKKKVIDGASNLGWFYGALNKFDLFMSWIYNL